MNGSIRCFSSLADRYACDFKNPSGVSIQDNATVRHAMRQMGVPETEVRLVFVNGKISEFSQSLNNGDALAFVPATGGL